MWPSQKHWSILLLTFKKEGRKKMLVVGLVLLRLANRNSGAQILSLEVVNRSEHNCVKALAAGCFIY